MGKQHILVTGGAGYVGAVLVPKLLAAGYQVSVLDLMLYGQVFEPEVLNQIRLFKGDLRDTECVAKALEGVDAVIHLACISNDPSFELDPQLGKSINLDAFEPLVQASQSAGVQRFIYASSSSVYGVKQTPNVTEDLPLEPLTDYSRFKADCEKILNRYQSDDFTCLTLRPATVCGFSPRLRLDVVVNILSCQAFYKGEITIFGGNQLRPNLHIEDMTDLYLLVLQLPKQQIAGKIYNAGYENIKVSEIAERVRSVMGEHVTLHTKPSDDNRSYHISSEKIQAELGFKPKFGIEQAIRDLKAAFESGKVPNALTDPRYYNIKTMQAVGLK